MGNGIRRKDQKHIVRDRADIMWQDSNINIYGFEDVNQIALDDRYGKVGAPLSKRRNGVGPAGRDAPPGLFGWNDTVFVGETTAKKIVKLSFGVAFAGVVYRLMAKK